VPSGEPTDSGNALDFNRAFASNISANFRIEFQNDCLVAAEKFVSLGLWEAARGRGWAFSRQMPGKTGA
jgi:hypothetical protein